MDAVAPPTAVDASAVETSSGKIRFEIDKDSLSTANIYSPSADVQGMLWRICMRTTADKQYLSLYLSHTDSDYKMRSVNAKYGIKLINNDDAADTIEQKTESKFVEGGVHGFEQFVRWNDVIDKDKGFLDENKLTVEMEFSLDNIIGLRKLRRVNFANPDEPSHDIALVVGDQKFHASKQALSIHSKYFHNMFNDEWKNEKEVEMKELNPQEFRELLNVLYPPSKKITDENVIYLLTLADRFDIDWIIDQCEQFLLTSTKFSVAAKLIQASRYRLFVLQVHCLDQLKTMDDVKNMKKSAEFKDFSDAIKAALCEKMMIV